MKTLRFDDVVLRPFRLRDRQSWYQIRAQNKAWLAPWEATLPNTRGTPWPSFVAMLFAYRAEARHGRLFSFAVIYRGSLVGQVTVGGVTRGSASSAYIGYWISKSHARRGLTSLGVALVTDFCFEELGLNRVEINVRPENEASIKLVERLGFRYEGLRRQYLHIDHDWRDHHSYALVRSDVPEGLIARHGSRLSTSRDLINATRT
jgi:ribosomal-protein-alanine N-acetyltransferase